MPSGRSGSAQRNAYTPGRQKLCYSRRTVARSQQGPNESLEKSPVVLIVDADELLRWSLREVLESEGFQVHEVGTAEATGAWIEAHETPAVALVDPELPDAVGSRSAASPEIVRPDMPDRHDDCGGYDAGRV